MSDFAKDINVPANDCISRQAALDAISCDITVTGRQNAELVAATIGAFADRIKALPTVQPTITHEQAINYLRETGWLQSHDRILTEHEQMYKRAFSVACELLIGANLFGVTEETMFREIMDKDGIVSSLGYEKYILDNLARLTGED